MEFHIFKSLQDFRSSAKFVIGWHKGKRYELGESTSLFLDFPDHMKMFDPFPLCFYMSVHYGSCCGNTQPVCAPDNIYPFVRCQFIGTYLFPDTVHKDLCCVSWHR